MNLITLTGNAVKEPLIFGEGDTRVAILTLAVKNLHQNKDGEYGTKFVDVKFFDHINFIEKVKKGQSYSIEGYVKASTAAKEEGKFYPQSLTGKTIQFGTGGARNVAHIDGYIGRVNANDAKTHAFVKIYQSYGKDAEGNTKYNTFDVNVFGEKLIDIFLKRNESSQGISIDCEMLNYSKKLEDGTYENGIALNLSQFSLGLLRKDGTAAVNADTEESTEEVKTEDAPAKKAESKKADDNLPF